MKRVSLEESFICMEFHWKRSSVSLEESFIGWGFHWNRVSLPNIKHSVEFIPLKFHWKKFHLK